VPRQTIHQMQLRQTSTRGLLWVLQADEAASYGDDEPTELTGLTVRFYDGDDHVRSTLTSKRGQVDRETNSLVAEDSVRVVTAEGDRLETEHLEWDPKDERVKTTAPFRLTSGGDVLTGVGIEADPDLHHYAVHSELRAVVKDRQVDEEADPSGDAGDDDGR
jgi:LPS export ABC transporter protein LptC